MGRQKVKHSELVKQWLSAYTHRDVFTADKGKLYCQPCKKLYEFKQHFQFTQHTGSHLHKINLEKYMKKPERQLLMTENGGTSNLFYLDLCEAFLSAGIPWNKLQNQKLRSVLEQHMRTTLPDESTLRRNYAPVVFKSCIQRIRDDIGTGPLWVQIDETTDVKGRYIANVLVGALRVSTHSIPHLILVKQLQNTNNATITQTVLEALERVWPTDTQSMIEKNFLLFLTDGAAYMVKAAKNLHRLYPKLVHLTCVVHALHRVAEHVRSNFKNVDKVISSVKAVFRKAPSRVVTFREKFPDLPMPPEPVIIRWGTWLCAVEYYAQNLSSIQEVLSAFDENDAICVRDAKRATQRESLKHELSYISANFTFLANIIKNLEKIGQPLNDAIGLIEEARTKIDSTDGMHSESIKEKFNTVLAKNKGYSKMKEFNAAILESSTENLHLLASTQFKCFTFAPITTVDTERSFSIEKALLEGRENLSVTSMEQLLICQYELCNY